MARTTIQTDSFTGSGSLGANWANLQSGTRGDVQFDGSNNRITGAFSGLANDHPTARWVGSGTFTNDQFSSLSLLGLSNIGSTVRAGVVARAGSGTAGSATGYEAYIQYDGSGSYTTILAKRETGSTFTTLHSATVAWANSDTIDIECEGTTIRLCKNGTPLGGSFTVTDSTHSTGQPGVIATANAFGDDWVGGSITAAGPVLSASSAAATGNGTASGTATTTGTDGTLYAVRSAAQPTNAQIVAGQDSTGAASSAGSLAITSAGAKTIPLTGVAVPTGSQTVWFLHRPAAGAASDSNVISAAWTQPAALAWTGTYPSQSGVAGSAFVHSGTIPTPTGGVGTKTYSATGLGASGLTVNTSTGQLQGTCGTAGTYTITPTVTDSSTAGTPSPQTASLASFTLTISAAGSPPTVSAHPSNLTVASGSSATFAGGFNGSPALSYQWQEFLTGVWTAMSGQTSATLSLGTVTLVDSGRLFRLGCTNAYGGPTYTNSATLTVTAGAVGTITSDVFADWGDATPLASLNIEFVTILAVADDSVVLQLVNQVTDTAGVLTITDAALTPATDYMLITRNADGSICGCKAYSAT